MRVRISHLTRKAKGVAHRDEDREEDILRIGRATDSEIYLPDARVNLVHATLSRRPGGFFIEAVGASTIRHNGASRSSAPLKIGDNVMIGPYDLTIVAPAAGEAIDVTIAVELVRAQADDLVALRARSRTSIEETGLRKRSVSWALSIVVFVLFIALPIAGFFIPGLNEWSRKLPVAFDHSWDSGPASDSHKFFAGDCSACHQKAFVQVRDSACLACHAKIEEHAPHDVKVAALSEERCAHCHKEHTHNDAIIVRAQGFCANCHVDLKKFNSKSTVADIGDFFSQHAEFRPTVVKAVETKKFERVSLSDKANLIEQSNLKFPHDRHLSERGVRGPNGVRQLKCADCHEPDRGGVGLLPIEMTKHCADCHQLTFDPRAPERKLPHGDVASAVGVIQDFYAGLALRGQIEEESAPASVRRRVGQPLREEEKKEALAWAETKAKQQMEIILGTSLCKSCHIVEPPSAQNPSWRVKPVKVVNVWMPKAIFVHAKHSTVDCTHCHDAPKSTQSSDVLMPSINTCRECHGGENQASRLPSPCAMCHVFHRQDLGPMRPDFKKTAATGN
ncbi:MAG: FHA domain-containing protein [Alphaproteobacteria bacterium]|nr:FHA domain-containing protein [Alphaproteobacteria bacterium]